MLQRSSAVRCRACAAIPTDKALGHSRSNIAPLRSLLRDARSAARVIANTRRASQYSTACVNSTDPRRDAQVVCGLPATVLQSILRPVHRVQSGRLHAWKKQRWPQTTSGSVRDLSTRWRPHLSRARVWASSSAAETGNSSKRVRDTAGPEAVVEGCAAEPPCALSDAQLLPRRRVAAARAREGEALSQQPAPPQRHTTPAFVP